MSKRDVNATEHLIGIAIGIAVGLFTLAVILFVVSVIDHA